jgi:hypothetical protein
MAVDLSFLFYNIFLLRLKLQCTIWHALYMRISPHMDLYTRCDIRNHINYIEMRERIFILYHYIDTYCLVYRVYINYI